METLLLTCRYQSVDLCSFLVAHELCSQADFNSILSIHHMARKLYDTNSAASADNQLYICGNFHDTPQMALQLYVLYTTAAPPTFKRPFFDPAVRVTLQLAVSQPVCLGFKPSWAQDQTMCFG
jgi:hypothetical protein